MMELNREEVIKSLECCEQNNCRECPSRGNCHELHSYALDLIKELTEENFILKQKRANIFEILDAYGRGRTDTVRKFADYLKKQSFMCDPGNGFSFDAIDADELDNYVKEFLED